MIDHRKLSTADVLAAGILDRPAPSSRIPREITLTQLDEENPDQVRQSIEAGGIKASMYYGCWAVWKHAGGYDGELLQYRVVTDHFENATLDDAVERAEQWYSTCYG